MSLMMMRAALIARNALPPQYQRVEYLESTGVQWIDTGVLINKSRLESGIDISMRLMMNKGNGANGKNRLNYFFLGIYTSGSAYGCIGGGAVWSGPNVNGEIHTFRMQSNGRNIYMDGSLVKHWEGSYNTGDEAGNFFLGNVQTENYSIKERIYSFKVEGESNLIPCRRKSDNKPGMWDTVSKTFLTNSGTGADFMLGPDVL